MMWDDSTGSNGINWPKHGNHISWATSMIYGYGATYGCVWKFRESPERIDGLEHHFPAFAILSEKVRYQKNYVWRTRISRFHHQGERLLPRKIFGIDHDYWWWDLLIFQSHEIYFLSSFCPQLPNIFWKFQAMVKSSGSRLVVEQFSYGFPQPC